MAVFVSVLAVAVALGCLVAIFLSDMKSDKKNGDSKGNDS